LGEATCSRLVVPPSGGLLPEEGSYVTTGPDNKPKLHYHRSGMSSVQPALFQGGEGRKTIHLPSLNELNAVQVFSVSARLPGRLPWDRRPRQGDIINIMDMPGVRSLFLSGIIYDRKQIPVESIGVLLYGYCVGVRSSRELERACVDVVAFRWLAGQQAPDFRSIARFCKRHLAALGNVFLQALELCRAAGMVSLGRVALDGTKVRANASRRKAMSYGRLSEKQRILAAEVSDMLADAQSVDADEDARFGADKRGDELPPELADRESRLAKMAAARKQLEQPKHAKRPSRKPGTAAMTTTLLPPKARKPRPKRRSGRQPSGTSPIPTPGS
jgi:transposase